MSQLGPVTPFPLPSGGAGLSGAPDPPRPWATLLSCVPELCRWGALPWGLTLDSSAAVHSCGCRLCKVCCHLVSYGAQTLNTFSEDYNSELVFSFLPLLAFSMALVSALTCPLEDGLSLLSCPQCQNLHDSEHLTWLIVNHIQDLISLSHEPPVQDFISAVHRNSAASGLFIQAIQSRCENLSTVSLPGAGCRQFSLP